MVKKFILASLCALLIGLPLLVRDRHRTINAAADDTVIILTGHNENLRYELANGFQEWYRRRTGRTVFVDWRCIGGISEVLRYLQTVYAAAFRRHWENDLHRPWTEEVWRAYIRRTTDPSKWATPLDREVCAAFYNSNVTSDVDLLFGGGASEFRLQAQLGIVVECGFLREHPELFREDVIPQFFAGEELWDREGRWFGQALSTFGILSNQTVLAANGIDYELNRWDQLAEPALFGLIALVDPAKSSASQKVYEVILQREIAVRLAELRQEHRRWSAADLERRALDEGWLRGLRLLLRISANARYYADAPTKMILDVSSGNSAVGITVSFMGQVQRMEDLRRSGTDRLRCAMPADGCTVSADPIAMLRGAPHPDVAKLFLEYVLGEDGQKVIAFSVGSPGGPVRSDLCRQAIRRDIYSPAYLPYRISPENFYEEMAVVDYRPERTMPNYQAIKWFICYACMTPHRELVDAWRAIIRARAAGREDLAAAAQRIMEDLSGFGYTEINGTMAPIIHQSNPAAALACQRKIINHFRRQYVRARQIAEGRPIR
jgi:ABC-type Fe3+ transport system substrate-binding protein